MAHRLGAVQLAMLAPQGGFASLGREGLASGGQLVLNAASLGVV